jgi:hypothetical protein
MLLLKNGQRRYDYSLVDFVDNDGATKSCPSLILGFIRYGITSGIPTPQFIHEDEFSLSDIQRNMSIDNTLYVVVHPASDYGPKGRSLYCLNLNCRAPPGRFLQPDLTGWWRDV